MRRRCSAAAAAAAVLCLLCLLPGRALATKSERDVNDYVTSIVRVFAQHQAYSVAPDYIDTDGSSSWWRQCVCFCFLFVCVGRCCCCCYSLRRCFRVARVCGPPA